MLHRFPCYTPSIIDRRSLMDPYKPYSPESSVCYWVSKLECCSELRLIFARHVEDSGSKRLAQEGGNLHHGGTPTARDSEEAQSRNSLRGPCARRCTVTTWTVPCTLVKTTQWGRKGRC